MFKEYSLEKMKEVIFKILEDEIMHKILYLSGGLVFYLTNNQNSNRKHEDIDFILNINDMNYVREYLKKNNAYDSSLDSLFFENGVYGDYGIKSIINDVLVSFSPFIIKEDGIYQRIINTKLNIKEARMYNILLDDYIEEINTRDGILKINTIEFMKTIKEIPNRDKDKYDIFMINKKGYNIERYERIKNVLLNMREIKHKIKFRGTNSLFIQDRFRISVTNCCNMSCYYCHNEGQGHLNATKFIDLRYIDDLVNFIATNNIYVKKINVTGGEPLLHPDILTIIKKLSCISKDIKLNTNGILLNENMIMNLKQAGLTAMNIGIDTLWNNQSKPNLYKHENNIEELKRNLLFARKNFKVSINTVITYYNYDKIDDIIAFCISNRLSKIKLIELINFDFWKNNLTNSQKSKYFKITLDKYCKDAKKIIYYDDRGRYDVLLKNGFLIRFGEDYCRTHACANLYSIINANGEYVCCQKSGEAEYIDFKEPYEVVRKKIENCNQTICNNKQNSFPRDLNGRRIIN